MKRKTQIKRLTDINLAKEIDKAREAKDFLYVITLVEERDRRNAPKCETTKVTLKDPEAPKKYLDSKKLINNTMLYLRKYDIRIIKLEYAALTQIVQIVIPHSKNTEVTDKEFCEWYMDTADIKAITKNVANVLVRNKVITLDKDHHGMRIARVNPKILKGAK